MDVHPILHQIERSDDDDTLNGFILKKSDTLTLIAKEYDFQIDGFQIIRNSDITECSTTPSSRHCTRIMAEERLIEGIGDFPNIDITDWKSALHSLKDLDEYVIIEDELDDQFLIGPIETIDTDSTTIRFFTGTGEWDEPRTIMYDEITTLQFSSRYLNLHRKYLKKLV